MSINLASKKAYIFDMDGVIIDNISFHITALKEFYARFGKTITDEYFQQHINGRTTQELIHDLVDNPSHEQVMELSEEKEVIYRKIYQPHLKATAGLLDFLQDAKSRGIKMAVATSAITSNVDFTLDGLNIRHFFDAIIDSTMVKKGKPDPEIYLKAADSLQTKTADCVVFEDAISGIKAAKNAGIQVVGICTTHTKEELADKVDLTSPDFVSLQKQTTLD